ncbi:MAG: CHAD domain-containing protein, partial [Hyphomicrobium sp.]
MAYRFKLDEPIQSGVRRIGGEQIDRAITELDSAAGSVTAVHEARKCLKRLRALLRLARPALGETVFDRENTFFRETGALLSHVRDSEILLETVIKLDARFPATPNDALARLRKALSSRIESANDPGS